MKLFVGSLPYAVGDEELKNLFAKYGTVVSARVILDRDTGRSKGFGFVEMSAADEGQRAMKELDGSQLDGRRIVVNPAKDTERERPPYRGGERARSYGG